MKRIRRIGVLFIALLTAALSVLTGCVHERAQIGSGEPGVVAPIDWTDYDALIMESRTETDLKSRELLLHKAEDMLMDTAAVCPIFYAAFPYLLRDGVRGFYVTPGSHPTLWNTEKPGATVLRAQICAEPDSLDYTVSAMADAGRIAEQTICGLMYYDEAGELMPDLAESYVISEDMLTYTFTLREGLRWSDGKPLDASDFVYAWNRVVAPETASAYNYLFSGIKGYPDNLAVAASADGRTLTVELAEPCAYFLDLCAFAVFLPVQQEYVESAPGYMDATGKVLNPSAWAMEAGFPCCGPYMLQTWKHSESMVLVKNPNYYEADKVKLDRVELMLSADPAAVYAAYVSGDLDLMITLPSDELDHIRQSSEFHASTSLGSGYAVFNVKSDVFAGFTQEEAKTLRRALAYLIDRQFIMDVVLTGGQTPANTFVPPGMADGHGGEFRKNSAAYAYPDAAETGYFPIRPDYEKARELLRSIGFTFDNNGKLNETLRLEYKTNANSTNESVAACLQQDFAELGIALTIKTMEWSVFVAERREGNFDIARGSWNADYNDAISMLEMWSSDSQNNEAQLGK